MKQNIFLQEYERAVIFLLGRLLTGGARGPGVFFIIPCVDIYEKIDMKSKTFEISPQVVMSDLKKKSYRGCISDPDQGHRTA
jgi:regulator of protease activity HflC (stomatin/prohibitin superfamily)